MRGRKKENMKKQKRGREKRENGEREIGRRRKNKKKDEENNKINGGKKEKVKCKILMMKGRNEGRMNGKSGERNEEIKRKKK